MIGASAPGRCGHPARGDGPLDRAPTLDGGDDRCAEPLGQGHQGLGAVGADDPAAGPDERALGSVEPLGRAGQGGDVHGDAGNRVRPGDVDGGRGVLQVDGYLDSDGLGSADAGVVGGLRDDPADVLGAPHGLDPPRDRAQHVGLTLGLVQEALALAQEAALDLPGHEQHRRRAELGLVQAAHRVRRARSRRRQHDPEPARRPGEPVCGVGGTLLVAAAHQGDPSPADSAS